MDDDVNPEVVVLLEELRGLGATVRSGEKRSSEVDISRAEKKLGFSLPQEYCEFLQQFGQIEVELERTWFFYGLDEALRLTEAYREEFGGAGGDASEGDEGAPYFPKRFLVLSDEGDFSNAASGTVFDADLDAMLETYGFRGTERDEAFQVGYWGHLLDSLGEIRDRIADPEDPLVKGGARDREMREKVDDAAPPTEAGSAAAQKLAAAVERLYEVFAKHPRTASKRRCYDAECRLCAKDDEVLNTTPLRDLKTEDLEHYAYMCLAATAKLPSTAAERAAEYKHFFPRILELIDELGSTGNPDIVVPSIMRSVPELALSSDEARCVQAFTAAHWVALLHRPSVTRDQTTAYLRVFSEGSPKLGPWLALWEAEAESASTPLRHAAEFIAGFFFEMKASDYNWKPPQFREMREWFLSKKVRALLERGRASEVGAACEKALERLQGAA